jgi:hypothetical protein
MARSQRKVDGDEHLRTGGTHHARGRLTSAQAQRLLGIDATVCTNALDLLVNAGFLRLTPTGQYVRVTDGLVVPPFRMTKASFVQGRTDQKAS